MNETIERNTLASNVAEQLRLQIAEGRVGVGEYLPPAKRAGGTFWCRSINDPGSRPVITCYWIVKSHPGKGTWVSDDALSTIIHPQAVKTRLGG